MAHYIIKQEEVKMDTHYICYVEGTDGGKRYKHWTLQSAQTEAERLARLTGKRVYVYKWTGYCEVTPSPVKWEGPNQRVF